MALNELRDISPNILIGIAVPPIAAILAGMLWLRMGWPAPRAAIVGTLLTVGGLALDWPSLRRKPVRLIPLATVVGLVVLLFVLVAPDL